MILAEIISRDSRVQAGRRLCCLRDTEVNPRDERGRTVGQNAVDATCPSSNKENVGMKSRLATSAAASSITSALQGPANTRIITPF